MSLNRFHKLSDQSQSQVDSAHWLTGRKQIHRILSHLLQERSLLQARFDGHPAVFTTAVIGINPKSGIMAMDEIIPAKGHKLFLQHRVVHLRGRSQGVDVEFELELITERRKDGIFYYQTGIPQELTYIQRRDNHRVSLIGTTLFRGQYEAQAPQLLNGYVTDLSLHGAGVVLKNLVTLRRGDEINSCVLQMPDQDPFFFNLEVRFAQPIARQDATRMGGRFIDLGKPERQRLVKIVCQLEREHARLGIE